MPTKLFSPMWLYIRSYHIETNRQRLMFDRAPMVITKWDDCLVTLRRCDAKDDMFEISAVSTSDNPKDDICISPLLESLNPTIVLKIMGWTLIAVHFVRFIEFCVWNYIEMKLTCKSNAIRCVVAVWYWRRGFRTRTQDDGSWKVIFGGSLATLCVPGAGFVCSLWDSMWCGGGQGDDRADPLT